MASTGITTKPAYKEITACRVCGGTHLFEFWNGGDFHIVEFPVLYTKPKKPVAPLCLVFCESCLLVQLKHTTDPAYLFEEFHYRSRTNESMREALYEVSQSVQEQVDFKEGDKVLDIGCNDGTLLLSYPIGVKGIGIDPAKNLQAIGEQPGGWYFINDYFPSKEVERYAPYKAITALAMFYDLDDPVAFCKEVKKYLGMHGVFVVQMNYLPLMLKNCAIDNCVHEHLTYFSLRTLQEVFHRAGLTIYKAETNNVNAGSIRVYARHQGLVKSPEHSVGTLLREEDKMGLQSHGTYVDFANRVEYVRDRLNTCLDMFKTANKRVFAYGASTRGTTLLQLLDTRGKLVACAERDVNKIGHYMVGSDLPIVNEDVFRREADYGLLLPYHFLTGILQREKSWLQKGGQFIVPLPRPRLVSVLEDVT
jgi:2-polyprenyl-3-methyl-5-hydroxy-6-metoxy-1,4-benzoquinol methylase